MSSTTVGEFRPAATASQSMRRIARRQRYLSKALAGVLSVVVLIWTILPLYNIVMVSLEDNNDVFSDKLLPSVPSLDGYRKVFTEGYWYLENFWHQFGNSIYVGAATTFLTLAIASAASFSISRMRIRHGWMLSNVALLTYVIPQSFLAIPFYRIMQSYGLTNNLWSVIAAIVISPPDPTATRR